MTNHYDFDVKLTCRHDECSDVFKQSAIEEIKKLSKYHSHIINGGITVDRKNSSVQVEISLHIPGNNIIASESDYSLEKAFDVSVGKVKAQLKKMRSKETDHRVSPQFETGETAASE